MDMPEQVTKWGGLALLLASIWAVIWSGIKIIFMVGAWKQKIEDKPSTAQQSEEDHGASMGLLTQILGVVNRVTDKIQDLREATEEENRQRDAREAEHHALAVQIHTQQGELLGRMERVEVRLDKLELKS